MATVCLHVYEPNAKRFRRCNTCAVLLMLVAPLRAIVPSVYIFNACCCEATTAHVCLGHRNGRSVANSLISVSHLAQARSIFHITYLMDDRWRAYMGRDYDQALALQCFLTHQGRNCLRPRSQALGCFRCFAHAGLSKILAATTVTRKSLLPLLVKKINVIVLLARYLYEGNMFRPFGLEANSQHVDTIPGVIRQRLAFGWDTLEEYKQNQDQVRADFGLAHPRACLATALQTLAMTGSATSFLGAFDQEYYRTNIPESTQHQPGPAEDQAHRGNPAAHMNLPGASGSASSQFDASQLPVVSTHALDSDDEDLAVAIRMSVSHEGDAAVPPAPAPPAPTQPEITSTDNGFDDSEDDEFMIMAARAYESG